MPLADGSGSREEVLVVVSPPEIIREIQLVIVTRRSPLETHPRPVLTGSRFWITVCIEGEESKGSNTMNVAQEDTNGSPPLTRLALGWPQLDVIQNQGSLNIRINDRHDID